MFSIINHRQFVAFYRTKSTDKNSRNSRIDDFLGGLSLGDYIYGEGDNIDKIVKRTIEYDEVDNQLSVLRQNSVSFLTEALE